MAAPATPLGKRQILSFNPNGTPRTVKPKPRNGTGMPTASAAGSKTETRRRFSYVLKMPFFYALLPLLSVA
jgi:hypothetical protein